MAEVASKQNPAETAVAFLFNELILDLGRQFSSTWHARMRTGVQSITQMLGGHGGPPVTSAQGQTGAGGRSQVRELG